MNQSVNRFGKSLVKFLKDESGQGTTEYVVFLAALVAAVFAVGLAMRDLMLRLVERLIGVRLSQQFFNVENMYRFQFKPPK